MLAHARLLALILCVTSCGDREAGDAPRSPRAVAAPAPTANTHPTAAPSHRDTPPLLDDAVVTAIASEISGINAKHIAAELSLFHRQRGSRGFHAAATRLHDRARDYGLADGELWTFPADGEIFYGTQRSRPAWDADAAELWELRQRDGAWVRARRIGSWQTRPTTLAQDSESGEATAELVDVGAGTSAADYARKAVRGKLVLVSSQPRQVSGLAIDEYGAAGIVSYAQNSNTAWRDDNDRAVRCGHLGTFPKARTFAFMVSLRQAEQWKRRLAAGETIQLHAKVEAGQRAGHYELVSAVIPGTDPELRNREIVYTCHLDHERPGANDNASGCAANLEVARTLAKLIRERRIPPPRRTMRFVWPPEIEGSHAFLNGKPEIARRIAAVLHSDMIGGGAATKAVFHVTRGAKSLPTFVSDVAQAFLEYVNHESTAFAESNAGRHPLVSPEGSRDPLRGVVHELTGGSDHMVYMDGSFRIPTIYMNDWPDRFIHTTTDSIDKIDATKIRRSAFIAAASGYFLARLGDEHVARLWAIMAEHMTGRARLAVARRLQLDRVAAHEVANFVRFHGWYERQVAASIADFAAVPEQVEQRADAFVDRLVALIAEPTPHAPDPDDSSSVASTVYRRNASPKGPVTVTFGYDFLADELRQHGLERPGLLQYTGLWGSGYMYAYEALNLVDGKRSVSDIRDDLAAIHGPVPLPLVAEYLDTLASIGVLSR